MNKKMKKEIKKFLKKYDELTSLRKTLEEKYKEFEKIYTIENYLFYFSFLGLILSICCLLFNLEQFRSIFLSMFIFLFGFFLGSFIEFAISNEKEAKKREIEKLEIKIENLEKEIER